MRATLAACVLALLTLSCATETGRLTADQEQRLAAALDASEKADETIRG